MTLGCHSPILTFQLVSISIKESSHQWSCRRHSQYVCDALTALNTSHGMWKNLLAKWLCYQVFGSFLRLGYLARLVAGQVGRRVLTLGSFDFPMMCRVSSRLDPSAATHQLLSSCEPVSAATPRGVPAHTQRSRWRQRRSGSRLSDVLRSALG